MNADKSIITERLSLGPIHESDQDALISIFKHEVVSATYMVPDIRSSEDEKKIFTALLTLSNRSDRYVYGIFLCDRLIGIINDTEINGRKIELGYALNPDCFSRGYMTEALNAMIKHLFTVGFDEVICGAFDHNLASIRVMQKCGMSMIEKTDEIKYGSAVHQCIYYSIKRS